MPEFEDVVSRLRRNWNRLGNKNPIWAVLTGPETKNGEWGIDVLYESGRAEIAGLFEEASTRGLGLRRERALDFGCGVGRLSQALCLHFDHVDAVDVAPSMLRVARRYNRVPDRCHYHHNAEPDLRLFEDRRFDFIYSTLVLQHMPPELGAIYLQEMLRVLAPGGLLVFQIPAQRRSASRALDALPDEAYRARLAIESPSSPLVAGAAASVTVRVRNESPVTWPCARTNPAHPVRLGNHWIGERTPEVLKLDDGRTDLPSDLAAGGELTLELRIRIPEHAGRYRLELDLVQERVTWFKAKGSPTSTRIVDVVGETQSPQRASDDGRGWTSVFEHVREALRRLGPAGRMEMHGMPRERVRQIVADAHAVMVVEEPYEVSGAEWESFRYWVRRPAG